MAPALEAIKHTIGDTAPVITLEPLLLQMYGPSTTNVFDFRWLEMGKVEQVLSLAGADHAWYLSLEHYDSVANRARYAEQFAEVDAHRMMVVHKGEGFTLFKLFPAVATRHPP